MGLKSREFRGDQRLESAAVSDAAHIKQGDRGDHVGKIQAALNELTNAALAVDSIYGPATAKAVLAYKTARNIVGTGYQTRPDNIVGRKTIASLDDELSGKQPKTAPTVVLGSPIRRDPSFVAAPDGVAFAVVVRGNPHVPANAVSVGLPPSIPPGKKYQVAVTITPELAKGETVTLSIIGADQKNGAAVVTPTSLSKSGAVVITGQAQTMPGNGGNLKLEAVFEGKVLATSPGFSVCAHPASITSTLRGPLAGDHVGIVVKPTIQSDSSNAAHLDQAEWGELVEEVKRDIPPYVAGGKLLPQPNTLPATAQMIDEHGFRPLRGNDGEFTIEQVYTYKCLRCGAGLTPIPRSGYEVVGKCSFSKTKTVWVHTVTKTATKTGVVVGSPGKIFKAEAGLISGGDGQRIVGEPQAIPESYF